MESSTQSDLARGVSSCPICQGSWASKGQSVGAASHQAYRL
jgi:hypothetical protein